MTTAKADRSIRLLGKTAPELDRISGAPGEIFLDSTNQTLRLYDGRTAGGTTIGGGAGGSSLTTEQVQDITAGLFNTSHSGISVSYNDPGARITLTVSNQTWSQIISKPTFATVATSGSYDDLTNKPTIPTNTSQLTNGAGFLTSVGTISYNDLTNRPTIPTNTNQLTNGAGFLTSVGTISYADLTNKPTIPAAYSATSINALSDVDTATAAPTANQPLVWNAGSSVWVPGAVPSLTTLPGVTITSPTAGQVLKYNGTIWINDVDATSGGAGVGTVTNVSVTSANGFTGTVATASSTPAITITTSITGLLKGNGTAISAAVAGTDYQTAQSVTGIVKSAGTTRSAAVAGTDYQVPVSATGILKSNGTSGNVTAATAGTDYLVPGGLSVTTAAASSGGSLSYSNGVFTFAPANLSGYLTSITSSNVTTALGFTPYNATNPNGYITTNGIPSQTGNSGRVLTTDGTALSWTVASTGSVASVSVVSANGFTGTVATSTTTPSITITTSITGLLKGNGTAISAAVSNTDYQAPVTLTTTGSSGAATFNGTTLNIPQYTSGPTAFSGLTDATSAGLTVDELYLQAATRLNVTNNGSSSYSFDQYAATNPTIYADSGTTIAFNLNVAGHPFLIRSGGSNFNTGLVHVSTTGTVLTGSSAQGQTSGTLYWKIPAGSSGNYQYICSIHGGMVGVITINPDTVTATSVGLGNVTNESKATMFASPAFTGTANVNNTANGVHIQTQVNGVNSAALGSFNGAPTVGSNLSGYSGIMFNGASLEPTLDGLNVRQSALVDIGSTNYRFKTGHFTGINFPATQSASTNANTLDDYEEGSWTPVAVSGTTSSVEGAYTKIGRVVYVNARVVFSSLPNSSTVIFNGLPYACIVGGVTYYSGGGREDISDGWGMATQVNAGGSSIGLNYADVANFTTRGRTGFNFFCWYIAN